MVVVFIMKNYNDNDSDNGNSNDDDLISVAETQCCSSWLWSKLYAPGVKAFMTGTTKTSPFVSLYGVSGVKLSQYPL